LKESERTKIGKGSNASDGSNETQKRNERGRVLNRSGIRVEGVRDLQRGKTQAGVSTALRYC
jgi:hypothetical protein